ncbi:MAG: orotidine-5'-phosphate decarboxylase [Gammaproteobacteria bacterium]
MNNSRIIVALDYADPAKALQFLDRLEPGSCRLKVGKELFCRSGPAFVSKLINLGFDVFLDLKFHDIPNTVAQACVAAADLGVWMINVHALGGFKMMEAARAALSSNPNPPLLIAVTILTSLGDEDIHAVGLSGSIAQHVQRLAALAGQAGMNGVVCSAHELALLHASVDKNFCLVTPGIRPAGSAQDDQRRIMTPGDAITSGANYLVIGRPITAASDPMQVLTAITAEIEIATP